MLRDYFMERSKKMLDLAKRIRAPNLAETFANRARLLKQTAMEATRSMRLANRVDEPRPPIVVSLAKTLAELRRELQDLPDGTDLCVQIREFSLDQRGELWRASSHLSHEFGCSAELRPDGCLWFVKR